MNLSTWSAMGIFAICMIYILLTRESTIRIMRQNNNQQSYVDLSSKDNPRTLKLLIASSLGPLDMGAYVHSMRSYLGTQVKFILNCHAGNASRQHLEVYLHEEGVNDLVLLTSALPGAKALFWKRVLTPTLVAAYDVIWLLDSDMVFDLDHFPLRRFLTIAMATQASIFQPAIIGKEIHRELRVKLTADRSVAQVTCLVEVMTPFICSDMWQQIHSRGLFYINDTILRQSSWGIDSWWCDLAATQQLTALRSNTSIYKEVPACLVVQTTPIVHLDTRTMFRGSPGQRDPRFISMMPWKKHGASINITGNCERLDQLLRIRHRRLYYLDEEKSVQIVIESINKMPRSDTTVKQVPSSWKKNAAEIYNRNRHQDVQMVNKLNEKWKNKILIGNTSSWECLQMLKNVTDPTDNSLMGISQWSHVLQVYSAMKADNVTSPRALFLALVHDFGKILVLFDEDYANVMCSTMVLKEGELGKGLERAVITWNHDEFGFQKLHKYLPRDMAWVIRYHSLSALFKGELDQFLTTEERRWFPLLRLLWKYDHLYKDAMHTPLVDFNEIRAILDIFLPRTILV